MTGSLILIAIGLVALAGGGELLVRGAVGIANRLGVSTLFTGLVIVGAATSMPEMVASVQAVMAGSPEIAWGNIVGSNIANSLLILGGAALVTPIVLAGVGRRDSVVALLLTLIVWGIAWLRIGSPFTTIARSGREISRSISRSSAIGRRRDTASCARRVSSTSSISRWSERKDTMA